MALHDYEQEHIDTLRSTLAECTVLLKKDGKFPLARPGRIAAYGNGVRYTIKGGTGSGEVNSRYFVNVEAGLEQAGFTVTTGKWLDEYDGVRAAAKEEFKKQLKHEARANKQLLIVYSMGKVMPEPEYDIPLFLPSEDSSNRDGAALSVEEPAELCANPDTAIYVLARISGEGNDRTLAKGDIKLTDTEVRDILALNEKYEKFMLVLNTGGVVDLSPVKDVKNILVLSQLGVETGTALADILLGKANPSGKLTTTWAAYEDYYPIDDIEDINCSRYTEGIYVGYRYFDSFGVKPLFPFGFGLSYTEFKISSINAEVGAANPSSGNAQLNHGTSCPAGDWFNSSDLVTVKVTVTNTGAYPGREVVQVYQSAPSGKMDKPCKDLAGFTKTRELAPGESEEVIVTYKMSDMASYDEETASYVLEAGKYQILVGTSSDNTTLAGIKELAEDVTVLSAKNVLGKTDFEDVKNPNACGLCVEQGVVKSANACETGEEQGEDNELPCVFLPRAVDYESSYEVLPEVSELPITEAAKLLIGDFSGKKGLAGIIGESAVSVCGAAGETYKLGGRIPPIVMADGPAGLRLSKRYYEDSKGLHAVGDRGFQDDLAESLPGPLKLIGKLMAGDTEAPDGVTVHEQYCTAIPIGTAIAQSFNISLAAKYGDIVGDEMERFGVKLWLAPALNIHRTIRCGRNFEYYSEDPVLSGEIAAGIVNGVQKHKGCGVTIKHYAANNKETNRYCNDSMVSERAMREIYLKGFGICVKKSNPLTVMTSYNLLNGIHTAEHRGLIEDILRCEYGFEGLVMTDWIVAFSANPKSKNRNTKAAPVAAAGGDLLMPGSNSDYKNLLKGIKNGMVSEEQVRICASRVVSLAKL